MRKWKIFRFVGHISPRHPILTKKMQCIRTKRNVTRHSFRFQHSANKIWFSSIPLHCRMFHQKYYFFIYLNWLEYCINLDSVWTSGKCVQNTSYISITILSDDPYRTLLFVSCISFDFPAILRWPWNELEIDKSVYWDIFLQLPHESTSWNYSYST